ncbi:hypothetical protein NC653_030952 [Populus alba x Populus x berolinensis]|uniref:Uncharacterized protein n=1 Tax=Populus alba x Populus x berolinensis TaxID=444605 RepID=A0AAD6Q0Y9_9ROSI|nr:hypothetical protein NC653_030952 [Populus alba x Populus x berolinensis]
MDTDGIMTSDRSMEKNPQVHATRNKTQRHAVVSAVILLGDRAMRPYMVWCLLTMPSKKNPRKCRKITGKSQGLGGADASTIRLIRH